MKACRLLVECLGRNAEGTDFTTKVIRAADRKAVASFSLIVIIASQRDFSQSDTIVEGDEQGVGISRPQSAYGQI